MAGALAPRVRLVVLNYNGGDLVVRCLDHLRRLDWPADRLELVVIDNASADGSDQVIAEQFPEVRLVRNPRNTGFVANNLGLRDLVPARGTERTRLAGQIRRWLRPRRRRTARCAPSSCVLASDESDSAIHARQFREPAPTGVDYVGLINQDAFVEPGWLEPLVAALDADPAVGAASARMLFADRFVEVEVESPTFVPGAADRRELGVQVGGARVDGKDRWRDTQVAEGTWGIEHDRHGGTFQWTRDRAIVRIPVPEGGPAAGWTAELRLTAEASKEVRLRSGAGDGAGDGVTVTVGPEPRWVPVPVGGEPVDVVNNVGSIVLEDGSGADRGYLERDEGQYDQPADVFAWCGGSVLFRPSYLADVGLLDERFFLYYEDTDLSWRGAARGWRYQYVPEAVTRHVHAASTGEGSPVFQYYVERNRLLMLTKNAPASFAAHAVWRFVLVTLSYARRDIVRPVLGRHRPNVEQVRRRLGSLAGYVRLLPGVLVERRRLRRAATVGDDELLARLVSRP